MALGIGGGLHQFLGGFGGAEVASSGACGFRSFPGLTVGLGAGGGSGSFRLSGLFPAPGLQGGLAGFLQADHRPLHRFRVAEGTHQRGAGAEGSPHLLDFGRLRWIRSRNGAVPRDVGTIQASGDPEP